MLGIQYLLLPVVDGSSRACAVRTQDRDAHGSTVITAAFVVAKGLALWKFVDLQGRMLYATCTSQPACEGVSF